MSIGSFVLMLHSHLPFYRKAGMWPFGEENVYECMAETYIPLLNIIDELQREGIKANLTIGMTPVLTEQLADRHINENFLKFLNMRIEVARSDQNRFKARGEDADADLLQLAHFCEQWFSRIKATYLEHWQGDIIAGLKSCQDQGLIEITTSAATHCFSPLLATDSSLRAQFKTGIESYKRHFGRQPQGFWLPECAYRPADESRSGIERWLHELGIKYFFTESFVIEGGKSAEARRTFGPYGDIDYLPAAARKSTGLDTFEAYWLKDYPVAVLGRHEEAGYQVWSADHGYPGDGNYREFHKKDNVSGLHYWKLTSKQTDLGHKQLYNPEAALYRVHEHSDHYAGTVQQQLTDRLKATGKPGLIMVSFDTELFGHWWFEGTTWIKEIIRKLKTYTAVSIQTASEYLKEFPPNQAIDLPESSWGSGGHWQVWLNNDTEWMWPIIHEAESTMEDLSSKTNSKNTSTGTSGSSSLMERALRQSGRELLLLQSSDWPFLITTGQAKQYAIERFNTHNERFQALAKMITSGKLNEAEVAQIEDTDNCFPDIKPKDFAFSVSTNVS